ncbi:MAG: hypothetical protein M1829_002440 [Trizodia sp. TS-e1964]|nr:MAG: hypothetical protein M1829_002440 [Trizodia sp. TS-e1964]
MNDGGPLMLSHGANKSLWGNVPALDVLYLKQNEGDKLPKDIHLLFAASGDIRNVVKTLSGLPKSFNRKCRVVVNDKDLDIVARNAILLLTVLHYEPDEATNMMLHIWYSALIPQRIFISLQNQILPLIQDVCAKICKKPPMSLQSKTWTYGSRSLKLVLQKAIWDCLPSYLEIPNGLSAIKVQKVMVSTTLAPERIDYLERAFYKRPPHWRICNAKFRKDGILLPLGSSRKDFNTPNPTFFQTNDMWPMFDSADPLDGWPLIEVFQKAPFAKNDIYGSLFRYLQDVFFTFCSQIKTHQICFQLFHVNAQNLPDLIKQDSVATNIFDRIEVSNIGDRGYLGPQATLAIFGPLLKPKSQNPHATLIVLFLNAVHETSNLLNQLSPTRLELERAVNYIQVSLAILQTNNTSDPDLIKLTEACLFFREYDRLFERFYHECRFEEISKDAGLKVKPKYTIVAPWPMRLKKSASLEEFIILLGSGHTGSERYVEWENQI